MANSQKEKRIFLVCQEDISSKICNKSVKFRDTDKLYILTEQDTLKLPEGLLDYFNNKEQILSLAGEELVDFLRKTRDSDKEIYYFIGPGAKEIYHEIGNDLILFSKGIAYNDTFGDAASSINSRYPKETVSSCNAFVCSRHNACGFAKWSFNHGFCVCFF